MERVIKIGEYRNPEIDKRFTEQMSEIPEEYHNTPRYKELKKLYDVLKLEFFEIREEDTK